LVRVKLIRFVDTYAYITLIKTKTTPSSGTSLLSDLKVAVGGEEDV
jgi:hypothetical protein